MSIHQGIDKIKAYMKSGEGKDLALVFIIILACMGSFVLGTLSVKGAKESPIVVSFDPEIAKRAGDMGTLSPLGSPVNKVVGQTASAVQSQREVTGTVANGPIVASSRGSKYYPVSCAGAKNLSEANKIYFNSETEAQTAGYTKSSSCK